MADSQDIIRVGHELGAGGGVVSIPDREGGAIPQRPPRRIRIGPPRNDYRYELGQSEPYLWYRGVRAAKGWDVPDNFVLHLLRLDGVAQHGGSIWLAMRGSQDDGPEDVLARGKLVFGSKADILTPGAWRAWDIWQESDERQANAPLALLNTPAAPQRIRGHWRNEREFNFLTDILQQ